MSDKKQCQVCEKNPASVHYTEIADARVSKLFICRECATARGLLEETPPDLEELMSTISKPKAKAAPAVEIACTHCGLKFQQFQQSGRLGCPACYATFREPLEPLLRDVHKHVRHGGRKPRAAPERERRWQHLAELRSALDLAVRAEDYERAARLRDEIRQLQGEVGEAPDREPPPAPGGAGT